MNHPSPHSPSMSAPQRRREEIVQLEGQAKRAIETGRTRLLVAGALFAVAYLVIAVRLAELTRRHLALAPLSADQMVRIEDLPLRLPPLIAETTPLKDEREGVRPSSITTEQASSPAEAKPAESIADLIKRTNQQP